MKSLINRIVLLSLTLGMMSFLQAQTDDNASQAYKKAYSYILNEQWENAITALGKVIDSHPDSQWMDDAEFWQCYAREKLGRNLEDVYQCYARFIETQKNSKYVDDAKNNMIRIGKMLVKQGKPEYKQMVKALQTDDDEDIALSALMALQFMGDEKGLPAVLQLYNSDRSLEFREKCLFLLSQFDAPEAEDKLIEIAKTDKDPEIRKKAIFWLGNRTESKQSDQVVKVLQSIMNSDPDIEVQEHVLFAFGQMGKKGLPLLIQAVKSHPKPELREKAIFWLGQQESKDVLDILKTVIETDANQSVREQAIFALSQLPDGIGTPTLITLAKTHPNAELREKAVFWIAQQEPTKEIFQLIRDVINQDPEQEVREKAVFALSQLDTEESLDLLIDIAKNHEDNEMRKKAIFWLGQSKDEKARDALLGIIQGSGR